jgi:hypothetical protein
MISQRKKHDEERDTTQAIYRKRKRKNEREEEK